MVNKPAAMVLDRSLNGRPDFSFEPSLDRNRINFNERSELIRLLSWATRGRRGIQRPAKVGGGLFFASLADIVSILAKAGCRTPVRERSRLRCRPSLLIVDEVEYLSVIRHLERRQPVLRARQHARRARVHDPDPNCGSKERGEFRQSCCRNRTARPLPSPVIQVEGSSYRFRQHADLMPDNFYTYGLVNFPIPAQPSRRRAQPAKNRVSDQVTG
jgi:hypothetical protein